MALPSDIESTAQSTVDIAQHDIQKGTRQPFRNAGDEDRFADWIAKPGALEIEIGSGKGLFLVNAAAANPATRLIGLELASKYATMCNRKLEQAELHNAICFCADGVQVMANSVPTARLDAVHVYFPDPWWKARHKKRRVLNERLIAAIVRTLKSGGKLHFWTDVLDYYESTVELLAETPKLQGPFLVAQREAESSMDFLTHFERRTRLNKLPVYRSYYIRADRE